LSVLIILVGVSLLVATGFLIAFLWSASSGQYDDDYTPSVRMLFEDAPSSQEPDTINDSKKIADNIL
jgi:cbb3-type cytochrome oxidase maturation protein